MERTPLEPIDVLYIGTDETSAERVATALEEERDVLTVATATSPAAALASIETNPVDCLVSAFDLEGTDGVAFLEELREQGISLPFVLFPDTAGSRIASRAVAADVDRYRPNTTVEESCEELAADIVDAVGDRKHQAEMLDRMTDGVMALDDRWRFRYLNEQGRRVICDAAGVDWDVAELQGRKIWDVLPEAVDTVFYENYHEAMETQEPVIFEEYYEPLGAWFEVRAFPSPTGLSVFFYDVTDRREYAAELERREGVLQEVHRITADKELTFGEKVSELLSIGREELDVAYGTLSRIEGDEYVFERHAGPDGGPVCEGDVVELGETNCERTVRTEGRLVLADVATDAPELTDRAGFTEMGIESYLGTPVFVDEEVTGTFCFYDDERRGEPFTNWEITLVDLMGSWVSYERERKKREAELQRERNRLEKFASVVSHDLRNPLNTAQLRLDQVAAECDSEHVTEVDRSLSRMEELVTDVLALARLGKQVVDAEEVPAAPLLDRAWEAARSDAARLVVADSLGQFVGDESRLQQLFENLFRNAAEHAVDPDSAVTVRVGPLPGDVGFFVADDGPGIPAAERDQVFEWGYTTRADGTGFGLATVAEIVDAHGGTITVTDSESGGARFEIRGIPAR